MIKLKSLLLEVHLEDLFHATYHDRLLNMLKTNTIKLSFAGGSPADHILNKNRHFFLSTSRVKYGNWAGGTELGPKRITKDVVINLNGRALTAAGFKIFPADYWGLGRDASEQEERIVSNSDEITPLNNFIKSIHIYVKPLKFENPFVLERFYEIERLSSQFRFPIYFYTDGMESYFKSQRTEKALRSISRLLPPLKWSPDDLEQKRWLDTHTGPSIKTLGEKYLRIFLDIYYNNPVDTSKYPGKNVMGWLLYYPHDAYAQIEADIHNLKGEHPDIFREIVKILKAENLKSVRELIKLVIDREQLKAKQRRDKEESSKSSLTESKKSFVVYHGTGSKFKKFNLKKTTQGIIWFTSDKNKILAGEVGAQGKGYIITAEVTINNPAGWDEYDKLMLGQLKSMGYDGVILPSGGSDFDCFVFSPEQVKILKVEKV